MNKEIIKKRKRQRRRVSIRSKVRGTKQKPRLAVFRSLKHIYAQIIDDIKGMTLISCSDAEVDKKKMTQEKKYKKKEKIAFEVGRMLAQKAAKKKIKKVVFDRAGFKYHGRLKALAEGARKEGLSF